METGATKTGAAARRSAFTLVEMLVSLAVLTVALSVVGVVFAVTARTASQSAAYSEVQLQVRQLLDELREDLRGVDPARSVLLIAGATQAAALSQADLEAQKYFRVLQGDPASVPNFDPQFSPRFDDPGGVYSDPRTDVLMFFTNRPIESLAKPTGNPATPFQTMLARGGKAALTQVVYGHAAIGQAVWSTALSRYVAPDASALEHIRFTIDGSFDPGSLSRLPASRWHLARRQAIIEPVSQQTKVEFTNDELNRLVACAPSSDGRWAGDSADLDVGAFFNDLGPNSLLTAAGFGAENFGPAIYRPYQFVYAGVPQWPTPDFFYRFNRVLWRDGDPTLRHVATVIEDTPADLRTNLGVQMLRGCVWFQVEFLMPEDPRNSVLHAADPNLPLGLPHWTAVTPGSTYLFVPDSTENRDAIVRQVGAANSLDPDWRISSFARMDRPPPAGPSLFWHYDNATGPGGARVGIKNRILRTWPYAVRITVRAFAPRGRLDQPLVRTLVHTF